MGILVLDTETTGIPVITTNRSYLCPSQYEYYNKSRLIELGYAIYSKIQGKWTMKSQNSILICPENFIIENSHIHGITNENALTNGQPIKKVLNEFSKILKTVSKVVTYNANFDINILLAEAHRCNAVEFIDVMNKKKIICAMKYAKHTLHLSRNIKLIDLHYQLFNIQKTQDHRALSDVYITADCFFHLIQLNDNKNDTKKITRQIK